VVFNEIEASPDPSPPTLLGKLGEKDV